MALTDGEDKEKALEILRKADERLKSIMENIGKVNDGLTSFSGNFNNAAKSVGLLNEELKTLKSLTGKGLKVNIGGSSGIGRGPRVASSSYSGSTNSREAVQLEKIADRLQAIRDNFNRGYSNSQKSENEKWADYRAIATKLYNEHAEDVYKNRVEYKFDSYEKYKKFMSDAESGKGDTPKFDKIDDFWSMLGLGRKSKWESYQKNPVQMDKKGGVMGDVAEGISGMKEKLTTLVTAHPYTAALLGIGVTLKFISDRVTELNRLAEKADKTNAEYLVLANQLMLGRTEHDKKAFEREQDRLKKERIDAAKEQKDGETWSALVGWIGDIGRNISMGYKKWAIGDDYEDQELSATIATAVKQTFDTLTASGATYDTAKNVGVEAYNLGLKYSENWLQQPSEMAANIAKAIAGDQNIMSQYGLNVNDKVLAGYVQYMYGEDMVNVEHTDTYKQIRRAELIEKELSMLTDSAYGVKALTNFTSQLYATGDAMEHFKQTLFGFDEVITLDAYDTTRPEIVGNHEVGDTGLDDMIAKFDTTLTDVFDDSTLAKGVQTLIEGKDENKGEAPEPGGQTNLDIVPYTMNIDASNIEDAFYDGSDYAYDMIYKAFKDGSELFNDLKIGVDINMPSGGTGNNDLTTLMMMLLLPSLLKGTGGGNSDVFTDLPSGAVDDNTKLYLNPIDTSAPASFLGYGPEKNSAKEWGFAWGGPGSATDILIDVTGNNNYIGKRMTMTDSEAREWASNNYYRFGPDEDGSTPARGVDIGNFYQPNSASNNEVDDLELLYRSMQVGAGTTGVTAGLGSTALGAALIATGIGAPLGAILMGLGLMGTGIGAYNTLEGTNEINKMTGQGGYANGGIGTKPVTGATLFEDGAEAVIPLESQAGIDFLGNAMRQAIGGEEGFGGDQIIVNLNLSGLNVADDDSRWEQIGTKIAEVIDVQRQRRGELNYGAAY